MDSLAKDFSEGVLSNAQAPCLSLYQPTHRSHPENAQDPIRFQNLVKELESSLAQQHPARDIEPLLAPLHALVADRNFWQHTADGMAALSAPGFFRVYRVQRTVPELAIAADSFHLKPLLRTLQSAGDYHVLGISRDSVALYRGNRYALDPVELAPDVPTRSSDVPGASNRHDENEGAMRSLGSGISVGYRRTPKSDVVDNDAEKFMRAVDKAVHEHYSQPTKLPLLLAGLPENESMFRSVSHNPQLVEAGIGAAAESMSIDQLRERAWALIEPTYRARLAGHVDAYGVASGRQQASDDLAAIAKSALEGRVATLLVEAERRIPGRIDAATGAVQPKELANPDTDDLLDDVAELVMKNGGEVVVVPAERMPSTTGAAAVFRY